MRNGSHRFWLCIAAAVAVTGIAVPAASAGVHKYDTKAKITFTGNKFVYGWVKSKVWKCEGNRRVVLFKERRGADRKLGAARTRHKYGWGDWALVPHQPGGLLYLKVTRAKRDGDVCLADRSGTVDSGELVHRAVG